MQLNKTWKLATGLMVLMLLAMPLLAVVPANVSAAAGNTLSINVFDDNGPVNGATASLTEVRKATAYADTSDSAGLLEFTPAPGYYSLKVSATGHFDYTYPTIIRFDGLSNVYKGIATMVLKDTPDTTLTFNVTSGGNAVSGALVTIKYDHLGDMQTMTFGSTNASGLLDLDVSSDNYTAIISKANYVTEEVSVAALTDMTVDVPLSASVSYSGTVTVNGAAASGVKVYMVDQNDTLSAPNAKVLSPTVLSSNYFKFDAYPGDFFLVVDANNALGEVSSVTVLNTATVTVDLAAQNLQKENSSFAFAADEWNSAVQTKTLNLDYDYAVPGLAYSYLPSIRMQIDLALGNGNGVVEAAEVIAFEERMESFGPLDVTTENMMTVASQMFISENAAPSVTSTGLAAAVTSTDAFQMEMVANYESASAITNGLDSYSAKVTTKQATASMGYTYELTFPSSTTDKYEMVSNVTTSSTIAVSGYTTAVVAAGSVAGSATLAVQKSVAPTAAAAVVTGVDAYKVMNGSTFLHYIVAQDVIVNFTAAGSSDPNGNPLSYTWDFGDGSVTTVTTVIANHTYAAAEMYTVNLTVTDQAELVAYKSFDLKVDGVAPTANATQNVTVLGDTLTVDQNKAYTFNSAASYDMLNETEEGLIASYKWVWGDGNTTTVLMGENQTVTKTWATAGIFTMYLNVTDVANHTDSHMVNVTVLDTVKPTVKFSVKLNGTVVTSAKENQTLTFDALASSDASGITNYTWDFGDGSIGYGNVTTHEYQAIKTFTVKLTLTDSAGNVANTTYSLKIESSARPDIRVGAVTFDPTKFIEGEDGFIYVNVTNVGTAQAEGIYAQLWKVNLDGSRDMLTDVSVLMVNDSEVDSLEIGQTGVMRFKYSFDSKGDYTLQVNVSANNEVSSKMTDNSATVSLTVEEAAWKSWLLYGGIFAVVIVVVVLFLFRKKLPIMPGKSKGPSPPSKKK